MTKKWLLIEKTPTSFLFLLWILNLNMGIHFMWSNGPMIILHAFKQMTKEEYNGTK